MATTILVRDGALREVFYLRLDGRHTAKEMLAYAELFDYTPERGYYINIVHHPQTRRRR